MLLHIFIISNIFMDRSIVKKNLDALKIILKKL